MAPPTTPSSGAECTSLPGLPADAAETANKSIDVDADGAPDTVRTYSVGAAPVAGDWHLRVELATLRAAVRSEKLGEVAAGFEAVHDIERARRVGSVHDIIPAAELRPRLIAAVERGMERALPS